MKQKHNIIAALLLLACAFTLAPAAARAAERDTPHTRAAEAALTAGEEIHTGMAVGQAGGYAYRYVSGSAGLALAGVAQNSAASNGTVRVRTGIFGFKNFGDVTAAHVGKPAYAATNDTAWTASAAGRAALGRVAAVDADYVWVDTAADPALAWRSAATLPTSTNGLARGSLWTTNNAVMYIP